MSDEVVMTRRFMCEHGKVRMMMVEPQKKDGPEYRKMYRSELQKGARWASSMDRVTVEVARQSDMKCAACDERRRK